MSCSYSKFLFIYLFLIKGAWKSEIICARSFLQSNFRSLRILFSRYWETGARFELGISVYEFILASVIFVILTVFYHNHWHYVSVRMTNDKLIKYNYFVWLLTKNFRGCWKQDINFFFDLSGFHKTKKKSWLQIICVVIYAEFVWY